MERRYGNYYQTPPGEEPGVPPPGESANGYEAAPALAPAGPTPYETFRDRLRAYTESIGGQWRPEEERTAQAYFTYTPEGGGQSSLEAVENQWRETEDRRWTRPTASDGGVGGDLDPNQAGAVASAPAVQAQPESQPAAGSWFASNAPATAPMDQGFTETYTAPQRTYGEYVAPQRPGNLAQPFEVQPWTETFKAPTMAELEADPGYLASQEAIRRGMERGAAARGSVLSGGFVGRTLPRAMAENTQGAYQNLHGRAYSAYQQRYGQHMDAQNLAGQARGINEAAYQGDVSNSLNAYNTRENSYQNTVANSLNQYLARRNAYQDAVRNNLDFSRLGLDATVAGRP